jgi:hypothetical protein
MARLVTKLLVLIAVLLMPFGMTAAPAAAAAHHGAAMPMQHCPEQAPSHSGKAGVAECTMACAAALPAVAGCTDEPPRIAADLYQSAHPRQLHGLHPDTATPPPKHS